MKVYTVDLTLTYNGTMRIEADNADEALRIAQESMNMETLKAFPDTVEMPNDGRFTFGEATADYAEEE